MNSLLFMARMIQMPRSLEGLCGVFILVADPFSKAMTGLRGFGK